MKKTIALLYVVAIFAIKGCGGHYQHFKNGSLESDYEYDKERAACKMEAMRAFPVANRKIVLQQPTVVGGGASTNCYRYGNDLDCTTTPKQQVIIPGKSIVVDDNAEARNSFESNCMTAKGWQTRFVKNQETTSATKSYTPHAPTTVLRGRDWCPDINNFCDTKGYRADKADTVKGKREWCPEIDNFCDRKGMGR
jgi:hypothetical protein